MSFNPEHGMRQSTLRRFIRFLVVGVVNTAFGVAVYSVLVLLGLAPQISLQVAFAMGVVWNYWTHARLVFDTTGFGRFVPYVLSYLLVYLVNSVALGAMIANGFGPIASQAVLAPFAAVGSFFLIQWSLKGKLPLGR